jgi:hypothetical protein
MNSAYENMSGWSVAESSSDERASFMRKTYAHLAGAVLAFVGLEFLLINSPLAAPLVTTMLGGRFSWFIVLALFMGVSWVANWWANSDTSPAMQYLGLGLYVVAEAIIFLPMLFIANYYFEGAISNAAFITISLFGALTAIVFVTGKDFSFLGPILAICGFVAMGVIAASLVFGFSIGTIFAGAMALFAGGAILYNTSNVMRQYRPTQHVAASLALFASVALLFWYILQLFMSRDD